MPRWDHQRSSAARVLQQGPLERIYQGLRHAYEHGIAHCLVEAPAGPLTRNLWTECGKKTQRAAFPGPTGTLMEAVHLVSWQSLGPELRCTEIKHF